MSQNEAQATMLIVNNTGQSGRYIGPMAKRKHIGTVVIAILVAILLTVGVSGWLFWQSVQRVIGEAQQAGEYAAEAQQSVGQGDFKQALEQMDSAGSHIVAARDET